MQLFLDESGSFSGFQENSLSGVGLLVVPDWRWSFLCKKYEKLRKSLPQDEKGEVKGKLLSDRGNLKLDGWKELPD